MFIQKASFWVLLVLAFMVGYFFVLTEALPSTLAFEPSWVKEGVFAKYTVEDRSGDYVGMNGTYAWKVISVQDGFSGRTVTVNETYEGTTHWDHVTDIPPEGRMVSLSAKGGSVKRLFLWLTRYYNCFMLDRTFFNGPGGCRYEGVEEGTYSFQDESKNVIKTSPVPGLRMAYHDRETGLLLYYSWTWPRLGTVFVYLNSTNIFDSTNVANEPSIFKSVIDVLSISPLFTFPLTAAAIGLYIAKQQEYRFSRLFWTLFILLTGTVVAFIANWPIRFPPYIFRYNPAGFLLPLLLFLINAGFWIGILGIVVLVINRFAIPLVSKTEPTRRKYVDEYRNSEDVPDFSTRF